MVHGKNRIPYWIDRRLTGLAGPEYHAIISFGLPFESEDCQYGKSQVEGVNPSAEGLDAPAGCLYVRIVWRLTNVHACVR